MPTFRAVTSGRATLTLIYAGGAEVSGAVDAPSNPGIFRPVLTPSKVGPCELRFTIASPQVSETFAAGPCEVFADEAAARAKLGEEAEVPGRITFLKEQQWKTDFATVAAGEQDLQDGVRATGEIRPVPGREAEVGAPVAGRVTLSEPAPILGMPMVEGQVLATIAPRAAAGRRSRDDGRRRRRQSRRARGGPR
jgi:cobalt-zinc-cadmium efflux system membrane fusion protein